MKIAGVVLAAGLGTRMKSSLPKVLHRLHGTPMLQHVLNTLHALKPQKIVVVAGKNLPEFEKALQDVSGISFAVQREPKGTGDALSKAVPLLKGFHGTVLVVNGDAPLITKSTLKNFLSMHKKKRNDISVLSFESRNPGSYGRIIRDGKGKAAFIIEQRDASESQKMIREVNSGVYAFESGALPLLKKIRINRSKGEYYLTDIIGIARDNGLGIDAFCAGLEDEFMGINTRRELENACSIMKERILDKYTDRGVHFIDRNSVFISSDAEVGAETIVYPSVHLEGRTVVGTGCRIYPNVRIVDSIIEDGAVIKDSTLIEDSTVRRNASVGPFAHVRPGSVIGEEAKIGNFVEVKKSVVGHGTKASHLSYLGDAEIGDFVNIGAGTITCNYDGHRKHVTVIEDGVFIGSDSQLVAPVRIGRDAFVGAGSTITTDVPSGALALSRAKQRNIEGWAERRRAKNRKIAKQSAKSTGKKLRNLR
ncbi:MAG TPA: bifunctional UDP-N-acetylglucosamine diphosphorylase/glucosamine-1-phosphate N-acetyltransferase GlmU [Thermodesulfovibrionales bacterium]|nr:bifunctional UDP-N-acetylglucosamine diphosphorylase/glucosamine-1-phosphate N-acetyltransferase GlmU [Thermodesulfovibrionales bacterium]